MHDQTDLLELQSPRFGTKERALWSDQKDMSGCAIVGLMSESKTLIPGDVVSRGLTSMRERSNGLGSGYAGYGIYPEHADRYAFHLMFDSAPSQTQTAALLSTRFHVVHEEPIPTRSVSTIVNRPLLHRYFLEVNPLVRERFYDLSEEDIVVMTVMEINRDVPGAFVFSSGKNMGVFKGVGFPEEIAEFFRIHEYEAHTWTGHARFPTNTTGWWGGAHPFGLLDWSVVHNGEVSSYGINKRYLGNFGYPCVLHTDTEVICYLFDLLVRKHGLPLSLACMAMAPPFWDQVKGMPDEEARLVKAIRMVYAGALLNGPFSVVVGHSKGLLGFNDRTKLRPMTAARKGDCLYLASEEAAIREMCSDPEKVWRPGAGEPVIGVLREEMACST